MVRSPLNEYLKSQGSLELKTSQKVDQKVATIEQSVRINWRFARFLLVSREAVMDSTDRELLSLLREDARVSVATLAKALKVARGTVQNRMARMETDGTIVGYTVKLKPQVEEQTIRALMTVAVEGNRTDEVLRALRGDPAVCALHTTNGRWDIVAELRADSLAAVDRVLGRIRLIDGISNTETSLLLSTHKF
jgi:DNA-binding Lrp family transcriptional regulator